MYLLNKCRVFPSLHHRSALLLPSLFSLSLPSPFSVHFTIITLSYTLSPSYPLWQARVRIATTQLVA